MPEGPEIRLAADKIQQAVEDKKVCVKFGLTKLKRWESKLSDVTISAIDTHGKAILTRFENGLTVYSHNQLYGRWICTPAGEMPETNRQLRMAIHAKDQSALLYSASDIVVLKNEELTTHPYLSKLGPDVLNPNLTSKQVAEILLSKRFRNRQLGGFLTDQSFVAGLGNYLRCEILFTAKCHPKTTATSLSPKALNRLAKLILEIPRQSYQHGGITNDLAAAKKLMENGADFESARFKVFRREGLPCYECGSTIIRKNKGGQACYYCPPCQSSN